MRVYLHEKKDQALTLCRILGKVKADENHIVHKDGSCSVWCNGHLFTLAEAGDYEPQFKRWDLRDLPINPREYRFVVKPGCATRLKVIAKLVNKASEVVIATDYDREGELIGRNVLDYCKYQGRVLRLKVLSLDDISLRRGLATLEDLSTTATLYAVAKTRVYCDWCYGINLSRLYSLIGKSVGLNETLRVGRVITPTVNLVVERDRKIAEYEPYDFYTLELNIQHEASVFTVKWEPDARFKNADHKVVNPDYVKRVAALVKAYPLYVKEYRVRTVQELPPLLFSQTALQIYCGNTFNLRPAEVLAISQALYDSRHRLITYPRSACRYLPQSQYANVAATLDALAQGDPYFAPLIYNCNPRLKSRVFDDAKCVGHAHHALIPNLGKQSLNGLSRNEYVVYDAIRRFYVAQFYLPAQYREVTVTLQCGDEKFTARSRELIDQGYRVVFEKIRDLNGAQVKNYNRDPNVLEHDTNDEPANSKLPLLREGMQVKLLKSTIITKRTKAPKHYTATSLIAAMANIAREVGDPKLKQALVSANGIGTEDTRATIVDNLIKCGYVEQDGKILVATPKAQALMAAVPWDLKSPELTAQREQAFENIKSGLTTEAQVLSATRTLVATVVGTAKSDVGGAKIKTELAQVATGAAEARLLCPSCNSRLWRLHGKYGYFWRCSNRECAKNWSEKALQKT